MNFGMVNRSIYSLGANCKPLDPGEGTRLGGPNRGAKTDQRPDPDRMRPQAQTATDPASTAHPFPTICPDR
jgi:hypothetical protein